jgi:hypothetical protein
MRTRSASLLLALVLLSAAAKSGAAALPFHATLTFQVNPAFSGTPIVTIDGSGIATSTGPIGGAVQTLALPASAVVTPGLVVPLTDPAAQPIFGFRLEAKNPTATFDRASGPLGGTMPLSGTFKVCLFAPCASAVANLVVPLAPFGSAVNAATIGNGGINTVIGAPWTTGTASSPFGGFTTMGSAHGPASGASTTFSPGGRVKLIAPVRVETNLEPYMILATLTIDFVPEPATGVLLGGGIAVLVGAARRRR